MIIEIKKKNDKPIFIDTYLIKEVIESGKGYDIKINNEIIYFSKEDIKQIINKIFK